MLKLIYPDSKSSRMCSTQTDSEVIHRLRFPLALMVVFLHSEPNILGWDISKLSSYPVSTDIVGLIMYGISHVLTQIAVPTFFLISGYLFFIKLSDWNKEIWKRKIVSRFNSIIIPYFIWVVVFIVIHIFRHNPSIIKDFNLNELWNWFQNNGGIKLFWCSQQWIAGRTSILGQTVLMNGPFPFHLWFLRDLIIVVLLTPFLYCLLKKRNHKFLKFLPTASLIILGLLTLLQCPNLFPGLSWSSIFFFGLGAYISINNYLLCSFFIRIKNFISALSVLLLVILIPLDGARSELGSILMPIWILSATIAIITLTSTMVGKVKYSSRDKKDTVFSILEQSSFFVFVIHPFLLSIIWTLLTKLINIFFVNDNIDSVSFVNAHQMITLVVFFTKALITAVCSTMLYYIMKTVAPRVCKILCGR